MEYSRSEILIPPDMKRSSRRLARRRGLGDLSSLIRFLLYRELTSEYGDTWKQDHPEGDQGQP